MAIGNDIVNFNSLIKTGKKRTILENTDLIALGAFNKSVGGNYEPLFIEGVDLIAYFITKVREDLPKTQTINTTSILTPDSKYDLIDVIAQSGALTLANPETVYKNGQNFLIRIVAVGTNAALTYDTMYEAYGSALPTEVVVGLPVTIGCTYNSHTNVLESLNAVKQ